MAGNQVVNFRGISLPVFSFCCEVPKVNEHDIHISRTICLGNNNSKSNTKEQQAGQHLGNRCEPLMGQDDREKMLIT
jgi:hypothetical protein